MTPDKITGKLLASRCTITKLARYAQIMVEIMPTKCFSWSKSSVKIPPDLQFQNSQFRWGVTW